MVDINEDSIRTFFAGDYFEQAKEEKRNVLEIEVSSKNNRFRVKSTLQSTRSRPYKNSITLVQGSNNVVVYGECDCPVSHNCKHVAATLLEAMDRRLFVPANEEDIRREKVNSWIDTLLKGTQSDEESEDSLTHQLFYVLKESQYPYKYEVYVKSRRCLKKGGYGKEASFKLDKYKNGLNLPMFADEIDSKIIKVITQSQDIHSFSSSVMLEGVVGNVLLDILIDSKKLYFKDIRTEPISRGKDIEFNFEWNSNKDEVLELLLTAVDMDAKLILLDTKMYIDTKECKIAKATGIDYSEDMLSTLLSTPPLHVDDAEYLSKKLVKHLPEANIPIPSSESIDKIVGVYPLFHLLLQKEVVEGELKYNAIFKVSYDGNFINVHKHLRKEVLSRKNSTLVEVSRDLISEDKAKERLHTLGFNVGRMDKPSELHLYFSKDDVLQESLGLWDEFLHNDVDILEKEGWSIELAKNFSATFTKAEKIDANIEEEKSWFNLSFDLHVDGKTYNTIAIVSKLLKSYSSIDEMPSSIYLDIGKETYVSIPKKAIEPMVDVLFELYGISGESFKLSSFDAPILDKLGNSAVNFSGSDKLHRIADALRSFDGIKEVDVSANLLADMRDYQKDGYSWLQFLREFGFGGILADDMGLGKTIQTLAHILKEKEEGRLHDPVLVIAPTSLMSNWRSEAAKFTPSLSVLVLQGSSRKQYFEEIKNHDIVLTTYPLIVRDFEVLEKLSFYYLILDEAQYIKNYKSKAAQHIRSLHATHRLCLTGTPMENHLGELWGLFDFLMPGFLFKNKFFTDNLRNPIEQDQNIAKSQLLNERVKPFLLRRTKTEVATELPEKTEIILKVPLGPKQSELYESIRIAMDRQVRDAIKEKGLGRSQIMILDALLKLRQVCCDPRLVKLDRAAEVKESAKFEMLFDLLIELIEEGRKILLFSQFTSMLALIEEEVKSRGIKYSMLTGQTKKRDEVIENFKQEDVSLFLISLKSGGVGLNLTEADTVIHYDPWWNPAAENQATDRAYRIGQDKPVFVYKLITENTLEEKIVTLQQKKQSIADNVYENKSDTAGVTQEDLNDLFRPISDENSTGS